MDNLASLDFQDLVVDLAAKAGISPHKVVLEVTESQLMGDMRVSLEILSRLRLKRFHLSIDDFGTGHSSLAQLRDIPFDELKIDQGFVHHAWKNETLRAIYDTSLALAKQLNMESVAEEWKIGMIGNCCAALAATLLKAISFQSHCSPKKFQPG